SITLRPPAPTPFPYTTLFRSVLAFAHLGATHASKRSSRSPCRLARFLTFARNRGSSMPSEAPPSREQGLPPVAPPSGKFLVQLLDRKSTRLNSSHQIISYAVF